MVGIFKDRHGLGLCCAMEPCMHVAEVEMGIARRRDCSHEGSSCNGRLYLRGISSIFFLKSNSDFDMMHCDRAR